LDGPNLHDSSGSVTYSLILL